MLKTNLKERRSANRWPHTQVLRSFFQKIPGRVGAYARRVDNAEIRFVSPPTMSGWRGSVGWSAIAVVGGLGVALLGIGLWMGLTHPRNGGKNTSAAMYSLMDAGDTLETEIDRMVSPAMKRTQILAESPQLIQAMTSADSTAQTALLNSSIKTSTEIDAVALFNAAGRITAINTRYASGEAIPPERISRIMVSNFSKTAVVQSCLRNSSNEPAIEFQTHCSITPAMFDSTGLSVACSVPMFDPRTGVKIGVISSRLRFDRLSHLADDRTLAGGAAKAYFVTDTGSYFSEAINSGRERPPVPVSELRNIVRPLLDDRMLRKVTQRAGKYLAMSSLREVQTIDGGSIHVLVIADQSWVMRGPRQDRLIGAAVSGLVGALLLIVAGLMHAQKVSRRTLAERKVIEQKIRYIALHDPLTGLANRSLLMDRINDRIQQGQKSAKSLFAIIFIDLDRFKIVNDSLGHDAGDKLLIAIAQRLVTATRGADTVSRIQPDHLARLGGDEFIVLLEEIIDDKDALRVCQRIQDELALPYQINGQEVRSSASLGVAISDGNYQRADELLRDADIALYSAKNSGRETFRMFHPDMRAAAVQRLWIESELRHAINREDLSLVYQPVFDLGSGEMIEVEALVRWRHAERGNIPPSEFIPVAEDTGLIFGLGHWVMRQACQQLKRWQTTVPELSRLTIAVNVSCRQFGRRDTLDAVRRVLLETGLDARSLKLEITETAVMDNVLSAIAELTALRDLGVQIHLDDFGTGYSSLGYLHQMPIEALKIDRSFINAMGNVGTASSIVQAITALAHSLNMRVIAEGVETVQQMTTLTGYGCDCAQGYYLSKPILPAELVTFARKHSTQVKAVAA